MISPGWSTAQPWVKCESDKNPPNREVRSKERIELRRSYRDCIPANGEMPGARSEFFRPQVSSRKLQADVRKIGVSVVRSSVPPVSSLRPQASGCPDKISDSVVRPSVVHSSVPPVSGLKTQPTSTKLLQLKFLPFAFCVFTSHFSHPQQEASCSSLSLRIAVNSTFETHHFT